MIEKRRFSFANIVVCLIASAVLAGCGGMIVSDLDETSERDYEAAQILRLVTLLPGDRFRWDNPDMTWTITATDQEKLYWESDTGAQQETPLNPLFPALAWRSDAGTGKRLLSQIEGSFFPMEVGAQVLFKSTVSTDKPPFTWEFDWACIVAGETRVNLPMAAFSTFRIQCSRQEPEMWTFYYAPSIGYYVMTEHTGRKGGAVKRRILTGYDRQGVVVGSISPRDGSDTASILMAPDDIPSSEEDAPPPVLIENGNIEGNQASMEDQTVMDTAIMETAAISTPQDDPVAVVEETADGPADDLTRRGDQTLETNADIMSLVPEGGEVIAAVTVSEEMAKQPTKTSRQSIISTLPKGYYVHLASYTKQANIERGWDIYRKKYKSELNGLSPHELVIDLPNKGRFARLMAGPVSGGKIRAADLCQTLKRQGQYCSVYEQN